MSTDEKPSRRTWLRKTVLFAAAVGAPSLLGPSTSFAQRKASKAAVHYRDYPNRGQMCATCKFFIGRRMMDGGMMGGGMMGGGMMGGGGMTGHGMMVGACQVVEGRISPMGWCDLYAPRGA